MLLQTLSGHNIRGAATDQGANFRYASSVLLEEISLSCVRTPLTSEFSHRFVKRWSKHRCFSGANRCRCRAPKVLVYSFQRILARTR